MVIGIYNRKGGVGKTTCAINLSAAFALKGKKVLLLDGDSQMNATKFLFYDNDEVYEGEGLAANVFSLYDVLVHNPEKDDCIKTVEYSVRKKINGSMRTLKCSFDAIPGSKQLNKLNDIDSYAVDNALKTIRKEYDYILIDFPPADDALTTAYLIACDRVVIPLVLAEEDSTDGFGYVMEKCQEVRNEYNITRLKPLGAFYEKAMLHKADQKMLYEFSMKPQVRNALMLFKPYIEFDYGAMSQSKDTRIPMVLNSYGTEVSNGFMKLADEIDKKIKKEG